MAEETKATEKEYVNVKFPRGFAHPYTFTDKNGNEWSKAIVNIPPNTQSNGIDLTGYSVDVFLHSFQQSQIASGEPLVCSFKRGEKVELFKGEGHERKSISIDPWALTRAVKAQREEYAAQKNADLDSSKQKDNGYSLASEQKDVSRAKDKLAEHDAQPIGSQER